MWDDQLMDEEELELLSFCYFFLGVLLPGFWGYLFIEYSLDPLRYNGQQENCQILVNWGLVAGTVFLIHACFYMIMSTLACLGARNSWYTKFIKVATFEDNYWRSFVLTFSLLGIFGMLGVLNKQFEDQFLLCGDLYKLSEMFYYVFFSIVASFAIIACLIQCSYENNMFEEEDEQEVLNARRAQRRRRRQQQNNRNNRNILPPNMAPQNQIQYQNQEEEEDEYQYNPQDFDSDQEQHQAQVRQDEDHENLL
ncbi:transmembrane protein, putative (macronuclear) [Tetrahymena thermophila SB210]|uniref:Transmembrane protein, putative n=1 Tax=Tetrahymena thermophila (strain SB210) TaxID=312017 RepID=I7M8J7_TETTS|nr:transmembrane protein, putative [Tetrahymena thermophila SB210]EAR98312.1 transmembrane protein, putative [Tetrahymena thermophila SB210]|eukprot:XP_001018557.1 transmembrane protein, putative [Tetrahymena thermophila SB210]